MLCPYCNNEMQHGEIFGDARGGMRFREDGKKLGFFEMLAGAGRITAVKGWAQNIIPADFCRQCKKMIIETDITK